MKQFGKLMLLTLGFGLLAALTGLVGPQPKRTNAAGAALAVAVTNTPGVNVANTPNVNVANTPAVNANQAGNWNVGINGTPNVNIANTPTVNLAQGTTVGVTGGNFSFSNTPSTPLFNRDIDNPANQPIEFALCISVPAIKCNFVSNSITVPLVPVNGNNVQRVVIEQVSGVCFVQGDPLLNGSLFTNYAGAYGPVAGEYDFPLGSIQTGGVQVFSQKTRLYQDPHQTLTFVVQPGINTIDYKCAAHISGYAVLL